ncbi:hypothetical protein [Corynebacterium pseudodiphtheriticum]|uniref:hypothetical protein n=1 Tax=Corynebacterium pseudodiphtheriticum TaxID=37637 RepID=UPI002543B423|nr:hypothetical protein [Corynebacterium pseudodiphtheriticum]MDK4240257.1 hypothetical protein [Corynebacterium pseudodiphtheriticum]
MEFSKSEIDLLRQQHPDLADRISVDLTSSDFLKLLTDVAAQRVPKRVIITEALRDYLNEHEQLGS